MKIKCIIVDDEPLAHTVLEQYISKIDILEVVKNCKIAFEAVSFLQQNKIDLIFLDINMPDYTGLEFLDSFEQRPKIIITSAYSEYALKSYDYAVTDYLLKPFSFERFVKAVNKVVSNDSKEPNEVKKQENVNYIFLKSDKVIHKVALDEINYIEAYGNFVKVHGKATTILVCETMNNIEGILQSTLFMRVHRSYIVSIKKIKQIKGNRIQIEGNEIPIGSLYKNKLRELFKL
jgi:DNA-binding LytR/AlgR family response regulator